MITERWVAPLVSVDVTFSEAGAAGVYTGSVPIPAGATIHDIKLRSTVLWAAGTSATMKVGDGTDDDGWFTGVNLKATDLLVGEEISLNQTGGKEGAYFENTNGKRTAYYASGGAITGVVTTVGTTSTAGRTRMTVIYSCPQNAAAATYVAS